MAVSQNGYTANEIGRTRLWRLPATNRYVRLRRGPPGRLLWTLACWFHDEVERVDRQSDDWGYAERRIRGGTALSNHASGTALDLNAIQHPLGLRGTFTQRQERLIHRWLAAHNHAVRWGGDYFGRADEMHFEIVVDVDACRAALNK